MEKLRVLLEVARAGGGSHPVPLTLRQLSERMGKPGSTLARWLRELEGEGWLRRLPEGRGQRLGLSQKGLAFLRQLYAELGEVLEGKREPLRLRGEVVSGLGEGSYYLRQEGYLRQFREQLGFSPYPGTLNVKLDGSSREAREVLQELPGRMLKGFRTKERSFGEVKCFPVRIRGKEAVLVLPLRSSHREVVELVAEERLRDALKLKDGDRVEVEVGRWE
jgi:riboflavin kinase